MPDNSARLAIETGKTAHQGGVIAEITITVHLEKIGEEHIDIVERIRAGLVPGQLRPLPAGQVAENILAELFGLLLQLLQFTGKIDVISRIIAQLVDLFSQFNQRLFEIKKKLHQKLLFLEPAA